MILAYITCGLITKVIEDKGVMNSLLKNLRVALELSTEEVVELTSLSEDRLNRIELENQLAPECLLKCYSELLSIPESRLMLLFSSDENKFKIIESVQIAFRNILNGYLSFCIWISSFDEASEKIPS